MENLSEIKKYKWDVAISLCKQDVNFAKKLVKAINPNLKIFYYEDRQEELISKSGPEAFAKIFKEESRVVVILSRSEWSNSFYTEIERNAIIDRTAVKNEGYQFLIVIPMIQDEIPSWYPSTQIYASSFRFSIEELAHFIEFKVAEKGGIVKPLTVEERYQILLDRIEQKKAIINLQHSNAGVQSAKDEIDALKRCFNEKLVFFRKKNIARASFYEFSAMFNYAYFGYGEYLLECRFIFHNDFYYQILTTQDAVVKFEIFKIIDNNGNKKPLIAEERIFYYTPELKGWAKPSISDQISNIELQVLFRDRNNSLIYDLTNPLQTNTLVDQWFQQLLSNSTAELERYI